MATNWWRRHVVVFLQILCKLAYNFHLSPNVLNFLLLLVRMSFVIAQEGLSWLSSMVEASQEGAHEMVIYYFGVSRGSLEPKDYY